MGHILTNKLGRGTVWERERESERESERVSEENNSERENDYP